MKICKLFLLVSTFVFLGFQSEAAVFTWFGGDGEWHDDNNWDLGSIPTLKDGVIISSGKVFIHNQAEANYISLNGGTLEVYDALFMAPDIPWYGSPSSLAIKGIVVGTGSILNNYGEIAIVEPSTPSALSNHIFCSGDFTNHQGAMLYLEGENTTGIKSYTQSSSIINHGEMQLNKTKNGMHLIGSFENRGDLLIEATTEAITNRYSFICSTYSRTTITGKIISEPGTVWHQYGELKIDYTSNSTFGDFSLLNAGYFEIHNSGSIDIDGDNKGIMNTPTGTFRNRGVLDVFNNKLNSYVIWNAGFMVNHQNGLINANGDWGVNNAENAEIRNYGTWYINVVQNPNLGTLWNDGVFANRPKGKLYVEGILYLFTGGTLNNQGHMFVLDDLAPAISSGFNNSGTLNDVHNRLSGINNTGIRVHKFAGPFTEGVPVANILEIGANPQATVLDFYTMPSGGVVAGSYDSNTNEFTPNANAVGLNSLFVRTKINKGNAIRRHELIIENGINSNPSPLYSSAQHNVLSAHAHATLSPNSVIDDFSVKIENSNESKFNYSIFNTMGQKESSGNFFSSSNLISIPQHLPSGIYFIVITDDKGNHIDTKQIRVIK